MLEYFIFFLFFILGDGLVFMNNYNYDDALEAIHYLQNFFTDAPEIAIVAGSGLGSIADIVDDKIIIEAAKIPHWPLSTAPSHAGKIIYGNIANRTVVLLQGRVHFYEGYSMKAVTFPARIIAMLGAKFYIATNASGAINTSYSPGEIIAVKDHINLMGHNPLIGPNDERWNTRFPDMSRAYDKNILDILSEFGLKQGVYAAFMGPSFETPAEIKMARILGADLAGMSTVPEIITANAMGLRCAALSCVANFAAGIEADKTLSAQEVIDVMNSASGNLADVIVKLIHKLNLGA